MLAEPRAILLLLVALTPLLAAPRSCWFSRSDVYGGWTAVQLAATGRFRVEAVGGVWWLVTPAGHPFYSAGINNVSYCTDWAPALGTCPYRDAVSQKYGGIGAWSDSVIARMEQAGLNTIGAWSEPDVFRGRFPHTRILAFDGGAPTIPGTSSALGPDLRDYFDPSFEANARDHAEQARACGTDPHCIGVYTDNELSWVPELRQGIPFTEAFMKLPANAPGKRALQSFLEARYSGDLALFNAAWRLSLVDWDDLQARSFLSADFRRESAIARADRNAFRGHVAGRYFRVVHDALRGVDPHVLILGARFLAFAQGPDTIEAAAPWVDVLSANAYEWNEEWTSLSAAAATAYGLLPVGELLDDVDVMYQLSGKPILVTEFGYRADDVGLPNSWPPVYPSIPDQAARADAYEAYMQRVLARPWIVGSHWFEWADQPETGRFDGEDNNWGFVSITDDVYPELFLRMWSVHARMYTERAALGGG